MIETVDILPGFISWWTLPVGDGGMQRYNAHGFFVLGKAVAHLRQLRREVLLHDVAGELFQSRLVLESFVTGSNQMQWFVAGSGVRFSEGCRFAAKELTATISQVIGDYPNNLAELFTSNRTLGVDGGVIAMRADRFETLFAGDCLSLDLFYVPSVLAYSSTTMIEDGERLIPETLVALLSPQIVTDIKAGARCIAFELPTAAAFHMARAAEGVMRLYHVEMVGPLPSNYQQQTFGSLVQAFTASNQDPALVGLLKHVKDHYRNPISHPDESIGIEQSHKMLGAYVTVMIDMLTEIQKKRQSMPAITTS